MTLLSILLVLASVVLLALLTLLVAVDHADST